MKKERGREGGREGGKISGKKKLMKQENTAYTIVTHTQHTTLT